MLRVGVGDRGVGEAGVFVSFCSVGESDEEVALGHEASMVTMSM